LSFAVDSSSGANTRLVAAICGLNTWEMISIIHKGANYGFPLREGNQLLRPDNTTAPLPADDRIPVLISDTVTAGTVVPTYPAVIWGHDDRGGDCAGSAYLYTGKTVAALRGKFFYNDLTTGRIWYSDYKDLLAADDGKPETMASMHEVQLLWDDPHDSPDAGKKLYDTMFPIVRASYIGRGGKAASMNGKGRVSGGHRADARLAVDAAGELYIYSKSDGMIRRVVAATPKPATH
jgi:hypothetical protein